MNYKGKDFKEMGVIGIFKVAGLKVFLFLVVCFFHPSQGSSDDLKIQGECIELHEMAYSGASCLGSVLLKA